MAPDNLVIAATLDLFSFDVSMVIKHSTLYLIRFRMIPYLLL